MCVPARARACLCACVSGLVFVSCLVVVFWGWEGGVFFRLLFFVGVYILSVFVCFLLILWFCLVFACLLFICRWLFFNTKNADATTEW